MAINKNFVIKNGVEVNTNLLVGDSTLNKVGIGTTVPEYTLHIGVGDGARGGIGVTDIHVSGIATIGVANSTSGALSVTGISTFEGLVDANGGISARTAAVQDLTSGRVVLAGSGGELEDNGNLTFDGSTLAVTGSQTVSSNLTVTGNAVVNGNVDLGNASGDTITPTGRFDADILPASDGAIDLGATGAEFQDLFIDGTANIDSLAADTAAIADLTDNRVVIVGSGGELEDSGNLTFGGSTLGVTGDITVSDRITVGTGITLFSHGGAAIAGIVTVGGNLNVTGDYTVDEISARNLNLTGIATIAGETKLGAGLTIAGVTTTGENLGGFKRLVGAASSTVVSIAVTVAAKTADHRYFGQGSGNGYWLDGVQSPFLT